MKPSKIFKLISIISYLLIILMGQMIGIPFIFWIVGTLLDFGNNDQLFALLAVIGLIINFINRNKQKQITLIILDLFCFFLLISPLIRRMTSINIELFNYLAFIIPATIFILCYLISIAFSLIECSKEHKHICEVN